MRILWFDVRRGTSTACRLGVRIWIRINDKYGSIGVKGIDPRFNRNMLHSPQSPMDEFQFSCEYAMYISVDNRCSKKFVDGDIFVYPKPDLYGTPKSRTGMNKATFPSMITTLQFAVRNWGALISWMDFFHDGGKCPG